MPKIKIYIINNKIKVSMAVTTAVAPEGKSKKGFNTQKKLTTSI